MTLSQFEAHRADVSHCLLRNGIFSRLGASPVIIEGNDSLESRAGTLAVSSITNLEEKQNFQKAAATWLAGDGVFRSVKQEILGLLNLANDLAGVIRGPEFPDVEAVKELIDRCDIKMRSIGDLRQLEPNEQKEWLVQFWRDALAICDVVGSLGIHSSKKFWSVFRSSSSSS